MDMRKVNNIAKLLKALDLSGKVNLKLLDTDIPSKVYQMCKIIYDYKRSSFNTRLDDKVLFASVMGCLTTLILEEDLIIKTKSSRKEVDGNGKKTEEKSTGDSPTDQSTDTPNQGTQADTHDNQL